MSAAAAWSYTATATLWPWLGRDDWTGAQAFGPPVTISCDYSAKAERRTDDRGVEFVTRQVIFTEHAGIKQQDRILIGDYSGQPDPLAAGALEVRAVQRYADTFDRLADDFEVLT
jgi:hypothetical protein